MSFSNPWAFIGLIAVVPLVLMYLFKEHVRTLPVSSLLFWERLQPHPQPTRSVRMRRFLTNPLFWIQFTLLLLLVGTLAQPVLRRSARKIVLVMDISASMQTRESGGSRLDLAKDRALSIVDELEASDRMALVTVAHRPELVVDFTGDASLLRETIADLRPLDTTTNMPDALSLIPSLQDPTGRLDVVVISDRQVERVAASQDSAAIHYRFLVVGETGENAGFTVLNQRTGPAGGRGVGGDLLLRNYVSEPRQGRLKLLQQDETVMDVLVELPPNSSVPVAIGVLPSSAPVTALFDGPDSLSIDNRVVFLPSADRKPTMLVTTDDARFVRVCRQLKDFRVTIRSANAQMASRETYDLYVYDRTQPAAYPPGGTIVICPQGAGQPLYDREIYDWDPDHPMLRDLVMERLSLTGARVVDPVPAWMSVLARTQGHPVIQEGEYEGYRRVIVSLNLARHLESPTMLLLFLKALAWINPLDMTEMTHINTGEVYIRQIPPDAGTMVTIRSPTGEVHRTPVQNGVVTYTKTTHAGVYEIDINGATQSFTANLLDASESDIKPYSTGTDDHQPLHLMSRVTIAAAYWRWVLWGVLCLLMVEWGYGLLKGGRRKVEGGREKKAQSG